MTVKFTRQYTLKRGARAILSEHEIVHREPQTWYGPSDDPLPRYRMVFRTAAGDVPCESLAEAADFVTASRFPMAAFMKQFPEKIAEIVTRLTLTPRPFVKHPLYEKVAEPFGVRLQDALPVFQDGALTWCHMPRISLDDPTPRERQPLMFQHPPPWPPHYLRRTRLEAATMKMSEYDFAPLPPPLRKPRAP